LAIGQDGSLYVASSGTNSIFRYDASTGQFIGAFVSTNSGGLNRPYGLTFGPDGNLYVGSEGTNSIIRYSGVTGALLGRPRFQRRRHD